MKRREFLSLALGAAMCISTAPAIEPPSKAEQLEFIYTGLAETAAEYVNGDETDRRIIIEELETLIVKMRSEPARKAMTDYRNMLLSYQAIEAGGVR